MSYCRWSSDDFQCDLYCYGSARGFTTHVAAKRRTVRSPSLEKLLETPTTEACDAYNKAMEEWSKEPLVEIGLPFDGQTFDDPDLESFLGRLLELKAVGYSMPDYLIPEVREEIEEDRRTNTTSEPL